MAQSAYQVLIVEDEPFIAADLAHMLEKAGYGVIGPFFTSGDALAWLTDSAPDAAILDVRLRDKSGAEVAAQLKRRSIPFVIYSGLGPPPDGELAGSTWISKPAPGDELIAALEKVRRPAAV